MWLMAVFTFKEALRKRVVLVAALLTLAFLTLYGIGLHFMVGTNARIADPAAADVFELIEPLVLFSMGIYLASFLVAGLAILAAVGSIAGEIENGTLYPLAARPLTRRDLLLGKYFGLAAMLVIYAAVFFLALVGLVYWQTGLLLPGSWVALALFALKPLVLLSVTMLGTTRLPTLSNGVLAFGLYALSVMGGMIEQIGAMVGSTAAIYIGVITSLILPADAVYRRVVATVVNRILLQGTSPDMVFFNPANVLGPFGSHSTPSDWMLVYTAGYIVVMLTLAIRIFNRRDV